MDHYRSINISTDTDSAFVSPFSEPPKNQLASISNYLQCCLSNLPFPCYLLICLFPFCPSFKFLFPPVFFFPFVRNGSWLLELQLSIASPPGSHCPLPCPPRHHKHYPSKRQGHEAKTPLDSREHWFISLG